MQVMLCGVRGSSPTSGAEFVRHGGHTACVALCHDGEPPSLILDAGTGLRLVDEHLDGQPFRGAILLGHLHWDHIQGLPFFASADRPESKIEVFMPAQGNPEALLTGIMSSPYFPITPAELAGSWRFGSLEEGSHTIEGFTVVAAEIPHPGGRTFGYRISDGETTLTYMSDHSPTTYGPGPDGLGEYHSAAMALAQDCDLLLHDAQYTIEELARRPNWGHSAWPYAVGLAEAANVKRLLLFHHDPARSDDALDRLLAEVPPSSVTIEAAAEGAVIDLSSVGPRS